MEVGLSLWSAFNGAILLAAIYLIYKYLVKPLIK